MAKTTKAQRKSGRAVAKDSAKAAKPKTTSARKANPMKGKATRKEYLKSSGPSGKAYRGGTAAVTTKAQRKVGKSVAKDAAAASRKKTANPKPSKGKATYKAGTGKVTYSRPSKYGRGAGMAGGVGQPRSLTRKKI